MRVENKERKKKGFVVVCASIVGKKITSLFAIDLTKKKKKRIFFFNVNFVEEKKNDIACGLRKGKLERYCVQRKKINNNNKKKNSMFCILWVEKVYNNNNNNNNSNNNIIEFWK